MSEATANPTDRYDLITSFHVFEHLTDPAAVLVDLSNLLSAGGEIIIEVPSSDDALLTLYKNEASSNFTYWSQHLFLFNQNTYGGFNKKKRIEIKLGETSPKIRTVESPSLVFQ